MEDLVDNIKLTVYHRNVDYLSFKKWPTFQNHIPQIGSIILSLDMKESCRVSNIKYTRGDFPNTLFVEIIAS